MLRRQKLCFPVVFRNCFAGFQIDLQRPDNPPFIRRVKPRARFGVNLFEARKKGLDARLTRLRFQRFAHAGRRAGGKAAPKKQAVGIKPRSAAHDADFPARQNILQHRLCQLDVFSDGKILAGVCDADHMVRHALHFLRRRRGGADCHAAVDLHGVAGQHLAVICFCQLDREPCLAGRGRTRDADDFFHGPAASLKSRNRNQVRLNCFSSSFRVSSMHTGRPCGQYLM